MSKPITTSTPNSTIDAYSKDIQDISDILATMKAWFREIETRGELHLRGWIVNQDNVGVGWVIFKNGQYSSLRYHRSIFDFDRIQLQLRIDNWQLKKSAEFERSRYLALHAKFNQLTSETEHKNSIKGRLATLLSAMQRFVSPNSSRSITDNS